MSGDVRRHPDPEDNASRLGRIQPGLTEELLHAAIRDGVYAKRRATAFHPPLTGPFNGHADTTATLRMRMAAEFGWNITNERGYPLTVRGDSAFAITVSTGDERTGLEGVPMPTTNCVKGRCTEDAIDGNNYSLFDAVPEEERARWGFTPARVRTPNTRTWLLLVHEAEDEIRSELSLPNEFGPNSRPDGWAERIILGAIPNDDVYRGITPTSNDGPDIDVDVTRRVG